MFGFWSEINISNTFDNKREIISMKTMIEHYIAHILKKSGENKQKLERKKYYCTYLSIVIDL